MTITNGLALRLRLKALSKRFPVMAQINIPDELVSRIRDRIQYTDFESVDEYTEFVLMEVITCVEREGEPKKDATKTREDVENRLQSLGYLED